MLGRTAAVRGPHTQPPGPVDGSGSRCHLVPGFAVGGSSAILLRVAVAGGSASLDRFHGPLDLSVEAGSLKGSGLLAAGSSRIRCQAGSVKINLERGSSVRVRARTELGKVLLPGDANWIGGSDAAREVTVGDGEALLEIETNMGSVVVSADR